MRLSAAASPGAEKGTLAVMVSGPKEIHETVTPVLKVIGKLFFVGTQPGQGQTMKLLNNLLSGTAMAISSEAVVMGVKAGLDPQQIMDVINAGSGRNSATQDKIPRCVIPRTFDFGFAISPAEQRYSPMSRRSRGAGRANDRGQRGPSIACA